MAMGFGKAAMAMPRQLSRRHLVLASLLLCLQAAAAQPATTSGPANLVYASTGQYSEGISWDSKNSRFIFGSLTRGGLITVTDDATVRELVPGNGTSNAATLGIFVDTPRNRVLVAVHSLNASAPFDAVGSFNLDTGAQNFLTRLDTFGGVGQPMFANDVIVDNITGTVYVTDTQRGLLWRVASDGSNPAVFSNRTEVFEAQPTACLTANNSLNGIDVTPDRTALITGHLRSGVLFKVPLAGGNTADPRGAPASLVQMLNGTVPCADGIRFRPDGKLVVTTGAALYLVESRDNWGSASIVDKVPLNESLSATTVTLREGRAYINYAYFSELFSGVFTRPRFRVQAIDFPVDARALANATNASAPTANQNATNTTASSGSYTRHYGYLWAGLCFAAGAWMFTC